MPNEPMTPDKLIADIDDNYAPLSVDAKIEIDALLAQLITSTLRAAADRACIACGEDMVKFCEKKKGGIKGNPCDTRKAILDPLNKE